MSDITTELRSGIHDLIRLEAAREIDRLRTDASAKDAEIARLIAANGDLQRWFDAAFSEFGRKDAEIARLRDAIESCIPALEIGRDAAHVISVFGDDRGATIGDALAKASAALAQVAEVGE